MLAAFDPTTIVVFTALAVLSVTSISVTIYKMIQFRQLGVGRIAVAEGIITDWLGNRPEDAIRVANQRHTVLGRVLQAVLSGLQAKPGDNNYAEELGRQTALMELATMSQRMRLLEAVVQAAPMLGLLGTVIGMIDAFGTLSSSAGAVDPALLASGIWTALTTTAIGLAIALITFFLANWFEARIEGERQSMETLISAAIHGRVDLTPQG